MQKPALFLLLALFTLPPSALSATKSSPSAKASTANPEKVAAYKRAKEQLSPDLYVVYRITERILVANSLSRPIRVAVRSGLTQSGACESILGVSSNSSKCEALELLPNIDKATNFDLWAAQVVSTMRGQPNAAAYSGAGVIYVNTAMLKELSGKPDQLACVIGHELAHVTQNHQEEERKKQEEFNAIAARKIESAATNAQNAQRSQQTLIAVLAGVSSGLSGNNYAINNAQMQIAMANLSAQIAAPQVAQAALKFSPVVGEAINKMQGLTPTLIKRTWQDVELYLRDAALSSAGFSRQQEYESDLIGLEYVTAAGFDGQECIKIWSETMPHDKDKLISRLLPKGIQDPGLEASVGNTPQAKDLAKIKAEQSSNTCIGSPRECPADGDKSTEEEESTPAKLPAEVIKALASTHPDGASRAKALANHLDSTKRNKLISKGQVAMNTVFIRNWSYDKESDSVIVSSEMVRPKEAGQKSGGTAGIDVDKKLGF
ncbi:MAG: hypothetical protein EB101_07970 [Chitinophagia bacterium]|nr:hypothetical protein [Chitinophagia bacterium]